MSWIDSLLKSGLGGAVSGIASGLLEPFKETFWNEITEGAARVLKLYIADKLSFFRNMLTGTLATLERALPSGEWGYAPKGFEDVLVNFIVGSTMLSILVGEELAQEFFAEMIQEGTSNAIQTSFGGYFQTLLNVFRGGSPLNPDDVRDLYNVKNIVDEKITALNLASAGANLYASIHYMAAGGLESIDRSFIAGVNQIQQLSLRALEHALWFVEYMVSFSERRITDVINRQLEVFDYYIQMIVDRYETAISRINDMIHELDVAISDYTASPPRITEEELLSVANAIRNEFNKLKEDIDDFDNKIMQKLTNLKVSIPQNLVDDYINAVKRYAETIGILIDVLNNRYAMEIQNLVNWIINMVEYLWAYRTYYPDGWTETVANPITGTKIEPVVSVVIEVYEKEETETTS
ncbi:MAG: hypothetical protein DRO14_06400 [Thermoprotei archaeon]|nr:MAG: hypothetical protein DRO14_06400 [Thermoprotei archaeon]